MPTRAITEIEDAKTRLSKNCAAASPPVLSDDDLVRLLDQNKRMEVWLAETAYRLDDMVMPTEDSRVGLKFKCVRAGTSGLTEPVWANAAMVASDISAGFYNGDTGSRSYTVGDGDAAWITCGPEDDLWDLEEASREGWEEKASRVAGLPNTSRGGNSYNFTDIYKQCRDMASKFGGQFIK